MVENPMETLWKSQQALSDRVIDAWRQLLPSGAAASTGPQAPLEQFRVLMQRVGELAGTTAVPFQAFLVGQRELAERMARWAQLQHDLADEVQALADQQRIVVDAIEGWAQPLLDMTATGKTSRTDETSADGTADFRSST